MNRGQSLVGVKLCLASSHYILLILTNEEANQLFEEWDTHVKGLDVDPPLSPVFSGDSHPYGDKFVAIQWAVKADDIVAIHTAPLEPLTASVGPNLNPHLAAGMSGFPGGGR
jgi:hypothetical protein